MNSELEGDDRGWLVHWLAVVFGSGIAVGALAGLLLGLLGVFEPWLVLVIAAAVAVLAAAKSDIGPMSTPDVSAVATVLLIVGVCALNVWFASEHVRVDRDPAIYLTTGVSLATEGDLTPDTDEGDFGGAAVSFSGAGHTDGGDGEIDPGFLHGLSALIGVAQGVAGSAAAVRVPAVLGLVAMISFASTSRRFVGPWWALLATAVIATNLVHTWLFRDTYSETLTQAACWSALATLLSWNRRPSRLLAGLAGLMLGAAAISRIDSPVLLLAVAAAWAAWRSSAERRQLLWTAAGVGLGFVLWVLDLALVSGDYFEAHRSEAVRLLVVSVVVSAVVAVGAPMLARLVADTGRRATISTLVGLGGVAVVVTGLARSWLTQPLRGEPNATLISLEQISGLEGEGLRTYADDTLLWQVWYLGWPVLIFAALGAFVLARRLTDPAAAREVVLVAAFTIPLSLVYLVAPKAWVDHLWVMRRFSTFLMPLLVLTAVAGAAWLVTRATTIRHWLGNPLGVVLGVVILVPVIGTVLPMRSLVMMDEHLGLVETICDSLPERAAIVSVARPGDIDTMAPALRAYCDVGVGVLAAHEADRIPEVVAAIESTGAQPVLVSRSRALLEEYVAGDLPPAYVVEYDGHPELTVLKPDQVFQERFAISMVIVGDGYHRLR